MSEVTCLNKHHNNHDTSNEDKEYNSGYFEDDTCWRKFVGKVKLIKTKSQHTLLTYKRGTKTFLEWLNMRPCEVIEKAKKREIDIYEIIQEFVSYLDEQEKSTWTIHTYLTGIKWFFNANGVFIDKNMFKQKVVVPEPETKTEDRIPTAEELQLMFNLMDLEGRAMLATLVSTGMRINELINFRLRDLHLNELQNGKKLPPHIHIQKTFAKGKKSRIVLLTPEAASLLEQYIEYEKKKASKKIDVKKLEKYPPRIRAAMAKKIFGKQRFQTDDERVFDMGRTTAWLKLHNAFAKVGLQKTGKRYDLHPHVLRKYTKTMMAAAGVQDSFIAMQLGHRKYMDDAYFKANVEMLAKQYEKAVPYLTIQKPIRKERPVDRVLEMARKLGITEQELFEELRKMFNFEMEIVEGEMEQTGDYIDFLELIHFLYPDAIKRAMYNIIQKRKKKKNNPGNRDSKYIIVNTEEKLLEKLNEGYELVKELNGNRYLLKAP